MAYVFGSQTGQCGTMASSHLRGGSPLKLSPP
jgi:hypothetical protein